jgi:predicted ATPase
MLTRIQLRNFKCFHELTTIPVRQINLFTGVNGRGKSTALQSLLLMRQSLEHSRTTHQIIFNGSCVQLGRFKDVRSSIVSQSKPIELAFHVEKDSTQLTLYYFLHEISEDDMAADIQKIIINGIEYENIPYSTEWYNLLPSISGELNTLPQDATFFTKIHYISADRIGPQDYYLRQSFAEFPNVGRKGEFTANVLSRKREDSVYDPLCLNLDTGATKTVEDQTAAWLDAIFGGGNIKIDSVEANIVLMALNSENATTTYKPINVGFGYSYALPIIVSGLIAQKGEILVVENPEAHLHPNAQSQLVKFLAKVSTCGVQVFIESHSEHILNGLRIAVLDQIIATDDLNILYFQREADSQVVQIPVGDDGSIEYWPAGFFDQTDKDYQRLFGF